jgi:hypothetical protein
VAKIFIKALKGLYGNILGKDFFDGLSTEYMPCFNPCPTSSEVADMRVRGIHHLFEIGRRVHARLEKELYVGSRLEETVPSTSDGSVESKINPSSR